ncbi:hypothetical protein OQH61_05680 [Helicobacter sp. MIT 21-1697]|uniref:hypothetical protein n=1 Tax=Helicobacter sp. MIT 21-1697 TaxID=2993733 RepID=UPI00224AE6C7|nr:hypothetical protein [Helicobacter sp. MIT 21-1697]MCX2717224.1 hypothetical protein [Helicobacter sp. MIT 21-1697]
MRRNSTHKQTLIAFVLFVGLYIYESLASMWIWLPPFIGVCFILFLRFDKEDNVYGFLAILWGVALIEAQNNLPLGMVFGLFLFLSWFVVSRIQIILSTLRTARIVYVILTYVSFYIMLSLFDAFMGSAITPSIWIVFYYISIEILIVIFL